MVEQQVQRGCGHPWTGSGDWDGLSVRCDSEAELTEFITAAEQKFWQVWIRDNAGQKSAYLYKPSGARQKWDERPGPDHQPLISWN